MTNTTPRKPRATSTRQRTSARPGPAVTAKRQEIGEAIVAMVTAPVEEAAATVAPTESEGQVVEIDLSEAATATESHEDTAPPAEEVKEETVAKPDLKAVPEVKEPAKEKAPAKVTGLVAGRLENQQLVSAPVFLANWASTRPVVHAKGTSCTLPKNTTEKARKDVLPIFIREQGIAAAKGKRTTLFCIRCTVQVAPAPKAATK